MKRTLAIAVLACFTLAGCRNPQLSEVVKETYIHKYGVPVAQSDWDKQGREGQIVRLCKDGVTITTSYSDGIVHGPTYYTFPNSSTIQRIENYSFGQLISKKENHASGVPLKEEIFEDAGLVKLTRWYEDGTPQANETYEKAFLVAGDYWTPLNVIESRIINGNGIRIHRSNEGDLLLKDIVQNGQMTERVTFYSNGDPFVVTPYENGVVHGSRLSFLKGGLPNTVEQWVNGVQEGITLVYQNGEKIAEVPYVQGKKQGIEYRFRDGDLLAEEITWKDDLQHGQRKLYLDGAAKSEWYHEGEVVSRALFERMNGARANA